MRQFADIIRVETRGRGLIEVTRSVGEWIEPHRLRTGLVTLFCRHTSASLIIQENAAPAVRSDLEPSSTGSRRRTLAATPMTTKVPMTCRRTSAPR